MPKLTDKQFLELLDSVQEYVPFTAAQIGQHVDDLKAELAKLTGERGALRQQVRELAEKWKGNREMEWVEKVHAEHETVRCIEDVCADELLALPGMKEEA